MAARVSDIPSREALELALAAYDGTLIIVSHDRHFVDQMADRILWIENGEAHLSEGGFAEALGKRERRKAAKAPPPKESKAPVVAAAPPPPPARAKSVFGRLPNEELESRIAAAEARLKELDASFTKSEVYLDPAKLKSAREEHALLRAELAALEDEWLSRSR